MHPTNPTQTPTRHRYVIGDLQGCYGAFCRLLDKIGFDDNCDKLYLCGDIVARGEDSLACLRLAKNLADKGALYTVLGNHDITLIAGWLGVVPVKPKDKTAPILKAPDCDELLDWLRVQPFMIQIDDNNVLTHAGIPHLWTLDEAQAYADELHQVFSGDLAVLTSILPKFYDKTPKRWGKLEGVPRLAAISDYLTRMRVINEAGELDFKFKQALDTPVPKGFFAWFDKIVPRLARILFGHWAALEGKIRLPYACALDGGAVWGGRLIALRLEDGREFFVHNHKSK